MTARRTIRLLALLLVGVVPACQAWHRVPLGPGGRPVAGVRAGTGVDLRFAAPRTFAAQGLPPRVARLRGIVDRARGDTLWVRVDEAAALGGELRAVEGAPIAPVVVNRDVAVQLRERSGRRLALVLAGVAGIVAIVLLAG